MEWRSVTHTWDKAVQELITVLNISEAEAQQILKDAEQQGDGVRQVGNTLVFIEVINEDTTGDQ